MKKVLFLITILLLISPKLVVADCTGKILSVFTDPRTGNVVVSTEYTLNGANVEIGRTRYNEGSGTVEQVKALLQADIEEHCGNLILRIPENKEKLAEWKNANLTGADYERLD